MSSFAVTLEKITVRQHPNADRLELARVGLFDAVVGKGQFKTGDVVLYIPEQAILPAPLIKKLGLEGKLSGKEQNRVKAVSLRGALSQGIVAPLSIISTFPEDNYYTEVIQALQTVRGTLSTYDFASALNITKWEPEIPDYMKGDITPATNILKWVDIENIKRFPDIFSKGDLVTVTEKVHGVCLMATLTMTDGEVSDTVVASKGYGDKRIAFTQSNDNLYWRAVNGYKVRELATELAGIYGSDVQSVGIYGEVFGLGIQDLNYGAPGKQGVPGFAVFDAFIKLVDGTGFWVPSPVLRGTSTDIPRVPVIFEGEYDVEHIAQIASGKEQVSGSEMNLREGVVIRSTTEARWVDMFGNSHRKIAKFVTEEYLTRKGGTEYQ